MDKKVEEMTEDERAVFDCLEDEVNVMAGAYEELEDDFMAILNGGALNVNENYNTEAEENKKVIHIKDEKNGLESHPMMIGNYKEKVAHLVEQLEK